MNLSDRGYLICPVCKTRINLEDGERNILRQAEEGTIQNVEAHCGNCKYKDNFRKWQSYIDDVEDVEARKFFLELRK